MLKLKEMVSKRIRVAIYGCNVTVKTELDQAKKYKSAVQKQPANDDQLAPQTMKASRVDKTGTVVSTMVPAANQPSFIDPKDEFKDDLAKDPIEIFRQDSASNFKKIFELLEEQKKTLEATSASANTTEESVSTDAGREKIGLAVKFAIGGILAGSVISGVKSMSDTLSEKIGDMTDWMKEKLGYSALESDETLLFHRFRLLQLLRRQDANLRLYLRQHQ